MSTTRIKTSLALRTGRGLRLLGAVLLLASIARARESSYRMEPPHIPAPKIVEAVPPPQTHVFAALDVNNAFTGNNTHSGTETFTGTINCTIVNTVRCISPTNPQGWAGADPGAWINSAAACAGGCIVQIASGTYSVTSTILLQNNVAIQGSDPKSTTLQWTGSASGNLFQATATNASIRHLQLYTTTGTSGAALLSGLSTNLVLEDVIISSSAPANGFTTGIRATGDGVSLQALGLVLNNVIIQNYKSIGINIDHTSSVVLNNVQITENGLTNAVIPIVLDSGVSGFYAHLLNEFNGINGILFRCTGQGSGSGCSGASGAYNYPPWAVQIDQGIFDSMGAGDCILFDSTLGANSVDIRFTNSWTASCNTRGIHISGGQKISWTAGGTVRGSSLDGILIDNANVKDVLISDSFITSNNTSNTALMNGISITAAAANVRILNNRIGNITEPFSVGFQKQGVSVSANAPEFELRGNDLNNNVTGTYLTTSTATQTVLGNRPDSVQNILVGPQVQTLVSCPTNALDIFDTTGAAINPHKYFRMNAGVLEILRSDCGATLWKLDNSGNSTLTGASIASGFLPNTAGASDVGSVALPHGNLWLGTAATNNFKFQPAATSGARIVTVADPLSPTTVGLPFTIASGTTTLTANAALAAVTSQAANTTAATGVLTTDVITWSFATAPTAGDNLCHVLPYVTAGNVNFVRTNPTAAAQNVSALVINWKVVR